MLSCMANVILDGKAPSDPSGIAHDRVRLQKKARANWVDGKVWDPVSATQVTANPKTECDNLYRWRVRARDNAGNWGPYSPFATLGIALS